MNNITSLIGKIMYDPVKGRIVYDFASSFLVTFVVYFAFWFSDKGIMLIPSFIYPVIFVLINTALGLYGKRRKSTLRTKSIILILGNFISLLILVLFQHDWLPIFLSSTFSLFASIMPRFFLNFNIERISFKQIDAPSQKNSPILVVGGGGYIGSVLVEQLLAKNYKVRVFDKFLYDRNIFKGVKNAQNLEIIEGDISDIFKLTLAVKDSQAIVHLAGIVGDPAAALDEKLTRHVNIASTRLLKETAKAFGVSKFIFASSCSVYGYSDKILTEKSRCKPVSLYAKTKLDSERELLSDTADNFHPVILRFATVFGHSRKPRFDLVANLFVAQAFFDKKIKVQGGAQWRPFIHVKDIARAITMVLVAPEEKVSRKIFNVGDQHSNITIGDLAKIVSSQFKEKIKIVIAGKSKDKRNYKVSFDKIHSDLQFSASISIEQGIREMYRNFSKGKYKKPYGDPYYVNSEMTKELKKEFYSKKYRKSHFSTIS